MAKINFTKYSIKLPSRAKISAAIPAELNPKLVELALTIFLGGFVAISKCNSSETRDDFLVRYVASLANDVDVAVRSTQMDNRLQSSNSKTIVEELLKSLHKS